MTTQFNLITGLSEYFKSDTQNIKNTYKVINSLRTELLKNANIVNLTGVKNKYNNTLQTLKTNISNKGTEDTLYNIFESKLNKNTDLDNKDLAVLGLKFNDIGTFLSNYIKSNKSFSLIIRLLPLLDAFYYYTDKAGKEIPYVFFALSIKLSNQNIQIADIEFILEFILLLYILDTDKDYYDDITFVKEPNTTKVNAATIKSKIKNPINILIYMYNDKIKLDTKSILIKLFTTNLPLLGSIKDISYLNLKKYFDYAVQENSNDDKSSNKSNDDYYTSFGHYIGHVLKFYIENDKYKIPQLNHLRLVVKLRDDLIHNNTNFYKYQKQSTQHGGSLLSFFKINKLYNNISHYAASKLNIMFRKSSTALSHKLINRYLAKQPNLSHLLKKNNEYSLKYYIESKEYSVFPLLLLSTTYDIINTFNKEVDTNHVNQTSTTNKQNRILNDLLTKDVLEYIKQYINKYSKKTSYKNIITIYGGLLKYLPVIIGLKLNVDGTNMTKKINSYIDYFLFVTSKITKIEADILNKLLYCMVITINLYNYGYIYYYKVNSSINIELTQHSTKKPFNIKKYKLTKDQTTLLYTLLKKIAKSIILDTDTFSSNILEIILLYKLHNLNKISKYSLFDNKLDLNNDELELLDNIFNTIIADDIYDMRYLVSIGTLNFYNKKKLIPQSGGNSDPYLSLSRSSDKFLTANEESNTYQSVTQGPDNTTLPNQESNTFHSVTQGPDNITLPNQESNTFHSATSGPDNTTLHNQESNTFHSATSGPDNIALPDQESSNNTFRVTYWFYAGINAVTGALQKGKNAVTGTLQKGKNAVTGTLQKGKNAVTGTLQKGKNAVTGTLQKGKNALSDAVNHATDTVYELSNYIKTTLSDTANTTMNEGINIVNAVLNIPSIHYLISVSDDFLINLTDLMREELNNPQKLDMQNNNALFNLTVKLNKINKAKYKKFIASKQTKEYKEFILLLQLKKFCNKLLEWQFVVSHVILEDKLKYNIHNNIFMSKYSEILLQNAETFNDKDKLAHLLNKLIKEKSSSKIMFVNL